MIVDFPFMLVMKSNASIQFMTCYGHGFNKATLFDKNAHLMHGVTEDKMSSEGELCAVV